MENYVLNVRKEENLDTIIIYVINAGKKKKINGLIM